MDRSEFPVVAVQIVVVVLLAQFFLAGLVGVRLAQLLQLAGWVGGLVYLVDRARATVRG
jgi:hypothetical protein